MSREKIRQKWFIAPKTVYNGDGGTVTQRIGYGRTPFFALNEISVTSEITLVKTSAFYGLYVLDGSGTLDCSDGEKKIRKCDQIFVPSNAGNIALRGKLRVLRFFGPNEQ